MVDKRIATAAIRVSEENRGTIVMEYNAKWVFKYFYNRNEFEIVLVFAEY